MFSTKLEKLNTLKIIFINRSNLSDHRFFLKKKYSFQRCVRTNLPQNLTSGSLNFNLLEKIQYSTYYSGSQWKNTPTQSASKDVIYRNQNVEKIYSELQVSIRLKNRIYKNDLIRYIDTICENQYANPQQVMLLVGCCSSILPDVSSQERMKLLNDARNRLSKFLTFDINHYHEILRCYKDNGYKFMARTFIECMHPVKPTDLTYQLLLAAVCEIGDMDQANEIISNMKCAQIRQTEMTFNYLIEGHGKAGNMNDAKKILDMMKMQKINISFETQVALIKAAAHSDSLDDLQNYIKENSLKLPEKYVMGIVKCLARKQHTKYVSDVLQLLPSKVLESSEMSPYMHTVCVQLIHEGFAPVAYIIYKILPFKISESPNDESLYCKKILRECVKALTPTDILKDTVMDLIKTGRNKFALQITCEAALQTGNIELSCYLIELLNQEGYPIRCHFFWPLFIQISKICGEKGIFEILTLMKSLNVVPDSETIIEYVIPFTNYASPQTLIRKFQAHGLSLSTVLTPMITTLLKLGKLYEASELCEIFVGNLDCELLTPRLVNCFLDSDDVKSLCIIIESFHKNPLDKNKDWVGIFLISLLTSRKWTRDLEMFESILKTLKGLNIGLSASAIDMCLTNIEQFRVNREHIERVKELLISMNGKHNEHELELFTQHIPHPKDMTMHQLEAHLLELESKNMNSRGVLRKLLQEYCSRGKVKEARTIIEKCEKQDVKFSAGMLANIFDLYVKCNNLHQAEMYLAELNRTAPNFVIDEHKVLDYATLLVLNGKQKTAFQILEKHAAKCRIRGGKGLETNCWRLLDAIGKSANVKETEKMFSLLNRLKYCQPTNVILGPLIRTYFNKSDLSGAVNEFLRIATTYKKTPLKHEVFCRLIEGSNDENNTDKEMCKKFLTQVLDADKKVYGIKNSQVSLVGALADTGMKKQLRRYVLDPNVSLNSEALLLQCQRLGELNKLTALEAIAECLEGIRNICTESIYDIIIKVHSFNGDPQAAVDLWERMQERNLKPSKKFVEIFCGLLKSHQQNVPQDMIAYLDKNSKIFVLD